MFRFLDIFFYILIVIGIAFPFLKKQNIENSQILVTAGDGFSQTLDHSIDSTYHFHNDKLDIKVQIKDEKVRMIQSDCKTKYCVKYGWLDKDDNGKIICMPQKVIIKFVGKKNNNIDAVVG
ncbi:MAG: NusG domain II-containing protein [Candidatus Delongbacteria bacterium]|nr:NusG domain II-containing protein [Candidatus Delongbacteria bacterium]